MLKLIIISCLSIPLFASPSADSLLNQIYKNTRANSESVTIDMEISKGGKTITRSLSMKRTEAAEKKSLIKILEPSSIKGLGLLSIATAKDEQQWIYLPSTKKSRSILSGNKKASFLDSHLNYEDLSIDMYRNYTSRVDDKNPKFYLLISTSKNKEASYARIETKVHKKQMLVLETKYFDRKGALIKTILASNYKKFENSIWRAQKILVSLPKTKDYTLMKLKNLSLKKISPEDISKDSLED